MSLAVQPGTVGIAFLASGLVGAALFVLVRTIRNTLYSEDLEQDDEWRYDVNRINELRQRSTVYRVFYPIIVPLSLFNRGMFHRGLPEVEREIQAAGFSRFWTPEEFEQLAKLGYALGFSHVASGPLVRSSYHADLMAEESGLIG